MPDATVEPLTPARRLATLVVTTTGVMGLYAVIGVWLAAVARDQFLLARTPIDDLVSFQPWAVVIYAGIFLQAAAPLSVVTDRRALDRTVAAYATVVVLSVPVWTAFPVTVPRPEVPIVDVWTYGVAIVRALDPPTNCLPSMHVALASLAALIVRRHDRAAGVALAGSVLAIWWSTVAIRQHWVTDGLVGIVYAVVADRLWFGWWPLPAGALAALPRRWHLAWIGAYVVAVLVLMSGWWLGWMPIEALRDEARRW